MYCTLTDATDDEPILFRHPYGALTAIEAATRIDVAVVVAYESAIFPENDRTEADIADRMADLIEVGVNGTKLRSATSSRFSILMEPIIVTRG